MIAALRSMRVLGVALIVVTFVSGAASLGLWLISSQAWQSYIAQARHAGHVLFDSMLHGAPLPRGLTSVAVAEADATLAALGQFERISDVSRPALVTNLAVRLDPQALSGAGIQLAIVSPDLRYPVSELRLGSGHAARDTVGEVIALMAQYCSPAELFAHVPGTAWQRIAGPSIWHCAAAPKDYRLLAVLGAVVALSALSGVVLNAVQAFSQFAQALRVQRSLGGGEALKPQGPSELREIISAFNAYRDVERTHVAERALVLSGVSHDLGTPATRLKLRASLIEDQDLRRKFEADIDQMTGIIESVLTYTRAELSTEEPRQMSLRSLVEAIVADYADVGRPVVFQNDERLVVEGGQSIFMSRRGRREIRDDTKIIIEARPVALRRAITNLIDNALKYGRRAILRIETDAAQAHILVEDEGGASETVDLNAMLAPFQRGDNAASIAGFGMGLTITSAIAQEHGGTLSFEHGRLGSIARLSVLRA